jgi:small-conductance mechanosensitive channel
MTEFLGIRIPMNPWVVFPLITLAAVSFAYLADIIILSLLKKAVKRTSTAIDDRIFRLAQNYLFPLLIVVGLWFIIDAVPLPPKILVTLEHLLMVGGLLLAFFFLTTGALLVLRNVEGRYEALHNVKQPIELFTKILFVTVGGMIILDNLGISLTPLLTTLGIGSLAVAIALQDTLGNFFGGLYLKADRPIEVGHYVRLDSGEEGYVERIGWRNTRIRMLPNNMVIVPNSKLAQSNITNFYLPDRELAVLVQVGVHYDSDLRKVEAVTCQVAKETMEKVTGGVASFNPFIRYHTFGDWSVNFTVILRGHEFVDNFLIKHEFIKKLHERYRSEGITIPFPIRTLYLQNGADGRRLELS